MTELVLEGVFQGALAGASLSAPAGLNVVLAAPSDGAADLAAVIGGLVVPRRGVVRVGGVDPARSPEARARIGLVLSSEPAFLARSTAEAVRQVLELRGQRQDPGAMLSDHGLGSIANVPPARLDVRMRRRVAWALALSIPEPLALVIHEPLSLGVEGVAREMSLRAEAGTIVVAMTSSPRDASELGGSLVLLDRGRFVRRPGTPLSGELAPGARATLRVRTSAARALAHALVVDPDVESLDWDEAQRSGELRVRGPELERISLAVLRNARAVNAPLISVEAGLPALDEVRAATEGLWRAAYDNAVRAAAAHGREREERGRLAAPPAAAPSSPPPDANEGPTS
jgi:ABC-type multidrug transport system ATPase subunit